ncbi:MULTISPECIES: DUF5615 family PIN-like protein [unclassified Anabaena]|uniref:DUF5615 family PIN-like protein n=1 Tax=unclassified Anabaena TaxID=2619674 RepID=UPI0039C5DCAA
MNIWIDAQLPPGLAGWLTSTFDVSAIALKDLGLRDAQDIEIFDAAAKAFTVIMTKDSDFVDLVCRLGIHHTFCGLLVLRSVKFPDAWERLRQGEAIVEISDRL